MPELAVVLKALGDFERLRLYHLFVATEEEICVCELVDALKLPQYQVSRHLQALRRVGLLSVRKRGTWAYYSALRSGAFQLRIAETVQDLCADEIFGEDKRRLEARFALRAGGLCVIGLTEGNEPTKGNGCDECR